MTTREVKRKRPKLHRLTQKDLELKYAVKESRDDFSLEQRIHAFIELEKLHQMSVDFGGPEMLAEKGLPWKIENGEYKGRKGERQRKTDCEIIQFFLTDICQDVHLTVGDRGTGKTLKATYWGQKFYSWGFNTVSNISLDFGYQMRQGTDILGIIRSRKYTIWVLDEFHMVSSKYRTGSRIQRETTGGIAGLRKQLTCVWGITSQSWQVGPDITPLIKYLWVPSIPGQASPKWRSLQAYKIGPWPREWQGVGIEQKRKIVVRPKDHTEFWRPDLHLLKETPKLYSSFEGIPTHSQSGQHAMAKDVASVDTDADILFDDEYDDEEEYYDDEPSSMTEEDHLANILTALIEEFPDQPRINANQGLEILEMKGAEIISKDEAMLTLKMKFGVATSVDLIKARTWLEYHDK